jgi:hypothetical protein
VFDSKDVGAHAYREKTHITANKTYCFLNFMIPPAKPPSLINLSGSGTRHFGKMDYIFIMVFFFNVFR